MNQVGQAPCLKHLFPHLDEGYLLPALCSSASPPPGKAKRNLSKRCALGVFNLTVLIHKTFSITEFFQVAEWGGRRPEHHPLLIPGTATGVPACRLEIDEAPNNEASHAIFIK